MSERTIHTGRVDPLVGYRFHVQIDGVPFGFMSISGLKEDSETIEYREGHEISTVHKIPGLVSYDDVTMEYGITATGADTLLSWRKDVMDIQNRSSSSIDGNQRDGSADTRRIYRDVQISVRNRDGSVGRSFTLLHAFPKSLEISDLSADSSDVLIKTVVLSHEGLVISDPTP